MHSVFYRGFAIFLISFGLLTTLSTPVFAKSKAYQLFVETSPTGAAIKIMNIHSKFRQGISLSPGSYELEIEKSGYETYRQTINIKNKDLRLKIKLVKTASKKDKDKKENKKDKNYRLIIDTVPKKAEVKLLNIGPRYRRGMSLEPGKYEVQVSHPGYKTYRSWAEIEDKDVYLRIALESKEKETERSRPTETKTETEEQPPATEDATYPLFIVTDPPDATINIRNMREKYSPGMRLPPGSYTVQIVRSGYESWQRQLEITDQAVYLDVSLRPQATASLPLPTEKSPQMAVSQYSLQVYSEPAGAEITILNIQPAFQQGMLLAPGKYHLQAAKPGYTSRAEWVEIKDQNVTVTIRLSEEDQCFALQEPPELQATTEVLAREARVKFYDQYVEVIYTLYMAPDRTPQQFRLLGSKQGNLLDLIGTVYYGNQATELRSKMTLQNDQLTVDFDGEIRTLPKKSCSVN